MKNDLPSNYLQVGFYQCEEVEPDCYLDEFLQIYEVCERWNAMSPCRDSPGVGYPYECWNYRLWELVKKGIVRIYDTNYQKYIDFSDSYNQSLPFGVDGWYFTSESMPKVDLIRAEIELGFRVVSVPEVLQKDIRATNNTKTKNTNKNYNASTDGFIFTPSKSSNTSGITRFADKAVYKWIDLHGCVPHRLELWSWLLDDSCQVQGFIKEVINPDVQKTHNKKIKVIEANEWIWGFHKFSRSYYGVYFKKIN